MRPIPIGRLRAHAKHGPPRTAPLSVAEGLCYLLGDDTNPRINSSVAQGNVS